MNTLLRALVLLPLLTTGPAGQAEGPPVCPYCADWKPLTGHRFLSAELLVVRMDRVALPGCDAAKARFLRETRHPRIDTANGLPPALLVYFRLEESPHCRPAVSGAESGALLELQYVPAHRWAGGEVELRVLLAHEIPLTDGTDSSAQWFAIPSGNL